MQLLPGHTKRVNDLEFSPDGRHLASCGNDRTVRLWDTLTGEGQILFDDEGICDVLAFALDGEQLLIRPRWGGLLVWSIVDRRCIARPIPSSPEPYRGGLAVARATGLVAASDWDYTAESGSALRLWGLEDWAEQGRYEPQSRRPGLGLAFDPNGTRLVTPSGVFDTLTGTRVLDAEFSGDSLAWSPTAPLLAGSGLEAGAWVNDAETGEPVVTLELDGRLAKDVAFSPDGASLVVVSGEGVARVWDTRSWAERPGFGWDIGQLRCVTFSPDGQRAACAGHRGSIMVWDWE